MSESPTATTAEFPYYAYDEYLIIFAAGFPDNPIVPPQIKEYWHLFQTVILELQAQVQAHKAQLAVVVIPRSAQIHQAQYQEFVSKLLKDYDALHDSDWGNWDFSAPDQAVVNFMGGQNIPVLDLMPGFRAYDATHSEPLYFQEDIHFNQQGHQLTADMLCDWLVDEKLVPIE